MKFYKLDKIELGLSCTDHHVVVGIYSIVYSS